MRKRHFSFRFPKWQPEYEAAMAETDLLKLKEKTVCPAHPLEHYDRCRGIKSALTIMTSSEVELESQLDLAWSH